MAKNKCVVLLGYDDELITEKNKVFVDFTTNKIGGTADWPNAGIGISPCPLCGQNRPLIVQIYAPLENSQFHRTLYIFACLNAPCSNQSQSWLCVRTQVMDKINDEASKQAVNVKSNIGWCSGADDWDDADTFMQVSTEDVNMNEENGNVIRYDNSKISDEDDESNSIENDPVPGFGNLNVDDKNANVGARGGCIENYYVSKASAEIEGAEAEVIAIDTPVAPKRDLIALLKQPQIVSRDVINTTLKSYFISVDEEHTSQSFIPDHVMELLEDYQKRDEVKTSPDSPGNVAAGGVPDNLEQEKYEKAIPIHGDVMFHEFMTKIQENQGQILRYTRDAPPLLISQLKEPIPKCHNCGSDVICELQVLPTIIPKLRLENNEAIPLDFGNVLVYTCANSCWDTPDKMRTENIIVQQEN